LEIFGTTEQLPLSTLSLSLSLVVAGHVGRTSKAHIVTSWCARQQQQQKQQQQHWLVVVGHVVDDGAALSINAA